MNREEEIGTASFEYICRNDVINNEHIASISFTDGAIWADEHPRKGLVDIEKPCEWLGPIFEDFAGYYCGQDLLNSFRKAMEE